MRKYLSDFLAKGAIVEITYIDGEKYFGYLADYDDLGLVTSSTPWNKNNVYLHLYSNIKVIRGLPKSVESAGINVEKLFT